jgi:hypothetical protein
MTLRKRDKTALVVLAAAVIVWLLLQLALPGDTPAKLVGTADSIPVTEKRLARLRLLSGGVPGKEEVLKRVSAELAQRETGIIQADTGPQAQAQLLEIIRRVAKAQTPPLDAKSAELGQITRLSDNYGEVQVSVALECRIEELLNLLADLTKQPEALATRDLRVSLMTAKEKILGLRLTVSGLVPRRLVPEKKGLASF